MPYTADYLGYDTPKLGFGLMRLPELEDGSIDVPQVADMVDCFLDAGLTYFDTAYVYTGSEEATRKALVERYPRDSYTLCSKANAWLGKPTAEEVKRQLETSLERLGTDYLDYYLLHAIQDNNNEYYDQFGLWDWIRGLKKQGVIRHWGFSYHADPVRLERLLSENPDIDFIQLQVNYADWNDDANVASRLNVAVAEKYGVPYTVMEPVKGGALANPPHAVRDIFDAVNPDASYASWAIRFAASQPGVLTVLSGMSTLEQVQDNVSYMRDFKPLSAEEHAAIDRAIDTLASVEQIKCTGCRYCCGGCPMGISIPDYFEAMNTLLLFENEEQAKKNYAEELEDSGVGADECIRCGQCEGACPQGLPIISLLAKTVEALA